MCKIHSSTAKTILYNLILRISNMATVSYPKRAPDGYVFLLGNYCTDYGEMETNAENREVLVTKVLLEKPSCDVELVELLSEPETSMKWMKFVWTVDPYDQDKRYGFKGVGLDSDYGNSTYLFSVLYFPCYPPTFPTM